MTTLFTINKEVATLIREGASKTKSATALKKKAAEELAAQGARGEWFSKAGVDSGYISKETLAGVQGLIASGLLDKAQFALWAMDSKAAKANNLQDERNALTSEVNKYLASFRAMIETAWRKLNPEEAKAEADEADEADEAEMVSCSSRPGSRPGRRGLLDACAGGHSRHRHREP